MRDIIMAAMTAAALATSAAAGAAVTVTSVAGPDGIGQTVLYNFNDGVKPITTLGAYDIVSGTTSTYAAPLGDNTPYLSVGGPFADNKNESGVAVVSLGQLNEDGQYITSLHNLSFYWGSIDS